MIPVASLQETAEQLMAKAAIEIPDDYLGGLRQCANTEQEFEDLRCQSGISSASLLKEAAE